MICPSCREENYDQAMGCFNCGHQFAQAIHRGAVIGGRYEVRERLGSGGMGTVYKTHDRVLDETVALKVLRPEIARSPDMEKRFRSEIKLARKVRHPNVCGIHEYGEDGDLRFISMELIEGIDLKQIIRTKGALPLEEAYEIPLQLGEGLQAIHDLGIIHRDLKTANVMRDARGVVRLMDFGIAKQFGSDASATATATGHILGTPEYMSPEQARSEPLGPRSDIYAMGIVIYEIFTGHVPFRGDTPMSTLLKQVQEPPSFDPGQAAGIPPPLVPVLRKALAKNPEQRQASVRELVEEVRKARAASLSAHRPPVASFAWPVTPGAAVADRRLTLPEREDAGMITPQPAMTLTPARATERTQLTPPPPARVATPRPTARVASLPPRQAPASRPGTSSSARLVTTVLGVSAALLLIGAGVIAVSLLHSSTPPSEGPPTTLASPTPRDLAPTALPSVTSTQPPAPTPAPTLPPPTTAVPAAPRAAPTPRLAPPVSESRPAPAAANPTPEASTSGRLQVIVRPWADVAVDGVAAGTTPFRPLTLTTGVHTVSLSHPDFKPFQRKVNIRTGEVTRLEVDLNWEAFRR